MPTVHFTHTLQRHVACPAREVDGATLGDVLDAVFRDNEQARRYILDDQGAVRRHIMIFVDGEPIRDPKGLSDKVPAGGEVYVMQALSGG